MKVGEKATLDMTRYESWTPAYEIDLFTNSNI